MDEDLAQLAQLCGIGLTYRDALGDERQAQAPQLVAVLDAMGVAAGTPAAVAASTAAVRRGAGSVAPPAPRRTPRCAGRSRRRPANVVKASTRSPRSTAGTLTTATHRRTV